jgi:hypothetical protein
MQIPRLTLALCLALVLAPASPRAQGFMSAAEADLEVPRGVITLGDEAFEGYTFITPINSTTAYLLDMEGEVAHRWECDTSPGEWAYLLDDGTLLRTGRADDDPHFAGGGIGGRLQRLAPDGTKLWDWRLASRGRHQHHDIEPLPNGNLLVIAWERIDRAAAIAAGRDASQVGEEGLWPDVVLEVKPVLPDGAEIVWEWHAWDHLVQDFDKQLPNYGAVPDRPGRFDVNFDHRDQPPMTAAEREEQEALEKQMRALGYLGGDDEDDSDSNGSAQDLNPDWMHTNSVDYQPELDLIVLSSPRLSEVYVIDHSTTTAEAATSRGGRWGRGGDLLWRWGNPRSYGAGTDADQQLFSQHDATWVPREKDGELRLLVFNNGRGRADGDYSSVDELVLPFDTTRGFQPVPASDTPRAWGPREATWSYSDGDGFYSAFISGCQRLPNGNTLVCSGAPGRLFEVTQGGEVVWDYRNGLGGEVTPPEHAGSAPPLALFRGTRYAPDHPGIAILLQ